MPKQVIEIPGPILAGRPSCSRIEITRHRKTVSLRWNVGSIDNDGRASRAFGSRLEAVGLAQTIRKKWKENIGSQCKGAHISCGGRWSSAHRISSQLSDEFSTIIGDIFRTVSDNLPRDGWPCGVAFVWGEKVCLS